jgi:hypothetical protein
MCVSNFKAFKNYFKMKAKTPHERKPNSEVVYPPRQMPIKFGILVNLQFFISN